jgi:hypothetical protein
MRVTHAPTDGERHILTCERPRLLLRLPLLLSLIRFGFPELIRIDHRQQSPSCGHRRRFSDSGLSSALLFCLR